MKRMEYLHWLNILSCHSVEVKTNILNLAHETRMKN